MSEFLSETTEDYNSPTTSSFTTRLQSCRNSVNVLEEVRPPPLMMDGWMINPNTPLFYSKCTFNRVKRCGMQLMHLQNNSTGGIWKHSAIPL